jgi:hypothetical protein
VSTIEPQNALLAVLAYQDLCVAEALLRASASIDDLDERLQIGRVAGEALTRCNQACDEIPGGQAAALAAMKPITSPIDEFWTMTRPRVLVEQYLRVLAVSVFELELAQRSDLELAEVGLWRAIDHGAGRVHQAITEHQRSVDELSLYARRLVGEVAVMAQRLIVRQEALRAALTGQPDDELDASGAVLDDVLASVAARLGQLGLSV